MSRSDAVSSDTDVNRKIVDKAADSDVTYTKTKKGRKKSKPPDTQEVSVRPEDYVRINLVPNAELAPRLDGLPVQLSQKDKAPQLQLSADMLSVTGWKGYRTVRTTHGVYSGTWYCEITVTHLGSTGHCRLGWCSKKAELQAPIGFDVHGFSYRDIDGSKVHKSWREPYGSSGYKEGDVIGLFIHMPPGGRAMEKSHKQQVRYKGALYMLDEPEPTANPVAGSVVGFTKNGEWQGVAFSDILEATYYPSASIYTLPDQTEGATVTFNFGPDFKYPLSALEPYGTPKAFSEVAEQAAAQEVEHNAAPLPSPAPVESAPELGDAPQDPQDPGITGNEPTAAAAAVQA